MPRTRVVHVREPHDVYIGRPGPWGNPFVIGRHGDRATVLAKFRSYLEKRPALVRRAKKELTGKRLGCFCHPEPCHGDIWIEVIS